MAITRKQGLEQIAILVQQENEGVNISLDIIKNLDYQNTYLEQVRACFDWNFKTYLDTKIPRGFRFKNSGFFAQLYWNPKAELEIVKEGEKFFLIKNGGKDFCEEVTFERKPAYYNMRTSDGKDMSRIAQSYSKGRLAITYSNECALKDKGLDCLFCNINATKKTFSEHDKIEWKNARQIAEVVTEAYKEGFHGYVLTGGFVPERREVEYYIDVIEEVKDASGLSDEEIHGLAAIGAPEDLSIIEKYKEAGYSMIATNLEVWNKDLFKYICPGKDALCGGRENWLNTVKHEVEVFGKWNVRSLFVGGLETKESLLEGVDYLSSIGVVADASIWKPCIGSALEGHCSPTTEWHQEVAERIYQIHKKNGLPYEKLYYARGEHWPLAAYFQLDGAHMPWEKPLEIVG
ncbi:MAG: nitrogen fixation protein NifB [Treponema sp.]|nr:nitrogen fixation protein NifB [Treponema sp.]